MASPATVIPAPWKLAHASTIPATTGGGLHRFGYEATTQTRAAYDYADRAEFSGVVDAVWDGAGSLSLNASGEPLFLTSSEFEPTQGAFVAGYAMLQDGFAEARSQPDESALIFVDAAPSSLATSPPRIDVTRDDMPPATVSGGTAMWDPENPLGGGNSGTWRFALVHADGLESGRVRLAFANFEYA